MEDPDAPRGTFVHWMLYDLAPGTAGLPKGVAKVPQLPDGTRQGLNDFRKIGYNGPCPPPGAAHRYILKLYALDSKPNLNPGASKREFNTAIKGHILALAELVGTFQAGRLQSQPGTTAADSGSGHAPAAEGEKPSSDPLPPRLAARIRALEHDEQYVLETDRLQRELEAAYSESPDVVTRFLRRFSLTSAFAMREIREFLRDIENEEIRRTLEDYVKYANRFRVRLRLRTDPVRFQPVVSPPYGEKFHVRIVGGHLEPATPSPYLDDPFVESFRSDDLEVLKAFQKLIDAGKATFIRIDDGPGYSILKDLESFAYKDDGVAFLLHNAEQPYLACIFGERMTKQLLADMGKAISEFQQKHFFRAHGGRPPNMERLKSKLQVERKPSSGKEKAAELAGGGDERKIKTKEVELSKLRSKRRKKNP